jgi:DNA invertase Pin-like site-specific DNA recombinase
LDFFSEAESAKSLDRAQFKVMQDFCIRNRKRVGAVVVYSVSRFSRLTSDHLTVKVLLDKLGIALVSVTEQISPTPMGRFTETLMSAQAQLDNELRAERTKEGMAAAVDSGNWVHRPPLGYLSADVPGGLQIDPSRASLIRTAFEMYAAGLESATSILKAVTGLGLRNRNEKPLSPQSFDKLLKNPLYAGVISIPSWGIRVRGRFEPIIDEALFTRVSERLQARRLPQRTSDVARLFPLRVFVRCSHCGQGLTGSLSTGRHGGRYGYYCCRVQRCRAVKFKQSDLHYKFLDVLASLQLRTDMSPLFREAVRSVWKQRTNDRERRVLEARKRVEELEEWRERVIRARLPTKSNGISMKSKWQRLKPN